MKKNIEDFLSVKRMAIAGVSRNKQKFGCTVFKEMMKKGYEVLPINPNVEEIDGVKCYPNIQSLPDANLSLLVVTPKSATTSIVKEAIEKGIKNIWIQQMADSREAVELAVNAKVNLVYGECIIMFAKPVTGFHAFHRWISKIFGRLPK